MSRLSRDTRLVELAPDHLAGLTVGGLLRRRVIAKQTLALEPESDGSAWLPAVNRLTGFLKGLGVAGSVVHLALNDAFVRYLELPWAESINKKSEELNLARIRFRRTFGPRADAWLVRVTGWRFGHPRLAVAVDAELVASIGAAVRDAGARLGTVQPLLVAAVKRWSRQLRDPQEGALFLVDDQSLLLARIGRHSVRVLYKGPAPNISLDGLLARECLRAGIEIPQVQCAAALSSMAEQRLAAFKGRRLQLPAVRGLDLVADARFSAAMLAA